MGKSTTTTSQKKNNVIFLHPKDYGTADWYSRIEDEVWEEGTARREATIKRVQARLKKKK